MKVERSMEHTLTCGGKPVNREEDPEPAIGMALVDQGLRFVWVNQALANYHQLTQADYPGRELAKILPEYIWSLVAPLYRYVIDTRLPIKSFEFKAKPSYLGNNLLCRVQYLPAKSSGVFAKVSYFNDWSLASSNAGNSGIYDDEAVIQRLTQMEMSVLRWLGFGKCTKEIASILHVSTFTVATHRRNICKKLEVHSAAEITCIATKYVCDANWSQVRQYK